MKSDRKKLVARLDKIFSLYIRKRDKACVICNTRENLTNGHLFSRIAYSTRWDEKNCHCNCSGCNFRHEHDASKYTLFFIRKYGLPAYEDMARQFHQTKKFTNSDLEKLIEKYR